MVDPKTDDAASLVERLLELGGRTNNKQLKDKLRWQDNATSLLETQRELLDLWGWPAVVVVLSS